MIKALFVENTRNEIRVVAMTKSVHSKTSSEDYCTFKLSPFIGMLYKKHDFR